MNPLRIGLTGGVASGKSTVAEAFAALGVPVFSADVIAHELTAPGAPLLDAVRTGFGDSVFLDDGSLDRRGLARRVFDDAEARARLESLLHPPIRARLKALVEGCDAPYCIVEIPLLQAADVGRLVDRVLLVSAPEAARLARLMARDGRNETEAKAILASQDPDSARHALADDRFENTGDQQALTTAVARLDQLYQDIATRGDPGRPGLSLPAD